VSANSGETVTYTLAVLGSGQAMTLTDSLPVLVSAPKSLQATTGIVSYNAGLHRVEWHATVAAGTPATITFPVEVLTINPQTISNTVQLIDAAAGTTTSIAVFIANGHTVYLPLVRR
jgi:hypothetical protein